MALTQEYLDWRLDTDLASQRIKLIRHIQELEQAIFGYETQKAMDQMAVKNLGALQEILKRREQDLAGIDDALGILPGQSEDHPFVSLRPVE